VTERINRGMGGEGGRLAPLGATGGGGGGLFKGMGKRDGGNARKVVYLCDATGSMFAHVDQLLLRELRKSVGKLSRSQSFNVMFFRDGEPVSVDPRQLMPATTANKERAFKLFGEVQFRGRTDPVPGLEAAFRQKPELIQLLSDAQFYDPDAVLKAIRRLNADKRVAINTYLLVTTELGEAEQRTMKQIAEENGGRYYYVRASELQQ